MNPGEPSRGVRVHAVARGRDGTRASKISSDQAFAPPRAKDKAVTVMVDLTRGPDQRLCARLLDAFHVVTLAGNALDEVRRRVQIEKTRRLAHGFRNFTNYRIGVSWRGGTGQEASWSLRSSSVEKSRT